MTPKQNEMNYGSFLSKKTAVDIPTGFEPRESRLTRPLFSFQRDIVRWSIRRGRAALFEDCGLGKTAQQLDWADQVADHTSGRVLILAPLAVADQTVAEGLDVGINVHHCRDASEICDTDRIVITNYERLHLFDPSMFAGVALDESSILKSYDGKTRTHIIKSFRNTRFKLACTATPAPNDYMELGNHAEFLGVMTREEMLSMFFTHDGGETSKWRLKGHAQSEFWRWLCSWAVNIRKPSDLGYPDEGFALPELVMSEHIVESRQKLEGWLFALPASSMQERRDARRASLDERVEMAANIANSHSDRVIAWCNLNNESIALTRAIEGAVEVTGSDSEEHKTRSVADFLAGRCRALVTKPSMFGYGLNLQCCNNEIFVGLSDSYEQFYQAVRRCWRFGQKRPVSAHLVISNLEGAVLANLKRKEADAAAMAEEMVKHMADISSENIRGVKRDTAGYKPKHKIAIPSWLQSQHEMLESRVG